MKQFNTVLRRNTRGLLSGALLLMSTMCAFNANAQTHISSTFSVVNAGPMTATSTCVTGDFAANWQTPGTGYWDYALSTVGFTNITMTFKNEKSSAAGPTLGSIFYNNGQPGALDTLISSFIPTTSCPSAFTVVNLPAACNGLSGLHIKVKMTGATANTATHRITSDPFAGLSSACSTLPTAGSISGNGSICAGTSATLSLTGASGGGGITYQWQSSPDNSTWSNLTGATGLSFTIPTTTTTSTWYRVQVTCPAAGTSTTTSVLETVNHVAFGAITGLNSTLEIVGTSDTIATTPTGGLWQSSVTSRATIDPSTGIINAIAGGAVTFTYSVNDATTGCVGTTDTTVNIVWPNTLALYAGDNGTSTGVITVPNEGTGNLVATGFGSATTCGSGGLSGLTMSTSINSFNPANPHVGYTIYAANASHKLNISRIHATTRESGTGPDSAIIAYRVAGSSTWVTEAVATHQNTGGSCGAASTSWDFAPSLLVMAVDSLEVAVFPYHASSTGGTFQLNSLEVYGIISDATPCSGLSHPGALEAPTKWIICDSGSRFLNYNMLGAGVGIQLTWQHAGPSGVFSDIVPADTTAAYNTGILHGNVTTDTFNVYRVKVSCSGTNVFSAPDTILVHARPAIGSIVSSPNVLFASGNFLHDGDNATLSVSPSGINTTWSTSDSSSVAIDTASGVVTGRIPGFAFVTARTSNDGVCFTTISDSIRNIEPLTVGVYVGRGGNSTATNGVGGVSIVSPVSKSAGFGSTTSCGAGGISGLVVPAGITAYNSSNPYVSMVVKADGTGTGFELDGIFATTRSSNSGPHFGRIIYIINGGTPQTDGTDLSFDIDDCGKSHTLQSFNLISAPTLNPGDSVEVRIYPFYGVGDATGGAFQVNTIDVISGTAASTLTKLPVVATSAPQADAIKLNLFPNPATDVLNVTATETVNVIIFSADGKKLIDQKGATQINISGLAKGLYLAQITDAKGNVIETTKFIKH